MSSTVEIPDALFAAVRSRTYIGDGGTAAAPGAAGFTITAE